MKKHLPLNICETEEHEILLILKAVRRTFYYYIIEKKEIYSQYCLKLSLFHVEEVLFRSRIKLFIPNNLNNQYDIFKREMKSKIIENFEEEILTHFSINLNLI